MATSDNKGMKPKRNWLLVGSLALNLLIVGLIVGALVSKGGRSDRKFGPSEPGIPLVFRALPEGPRDDARNELKQYRESEKDRRREMRELRDKLIVALETEPFDDGAIQALVDRQAGMIAGVQTSVGKILLDTINDMSPAERAEYAQNLRAPKKFSPPRKK